MVATIFHNLNSRTFKDFQGHFFLFSRTLGIKIQGHSRTKSQFSSFFKEIQGCGLILSAKRGPNMLEKGNLRQPNSIFLIPKMIHQIITFPSHHTFPLLIGTWDSNILQTILRTILFGRIKSFEE